MDRADARVRNDRLASTRPYRDRRAGQGTPAREGFCTGSADRDDPPTDLLDERCHRVARELGHGAFPPSVRREIVAFTKDHPKTEVRDLFERFVPESERIRRLGDSIDPAEILAIKGDPGRGRALFTAESAVNCKSCHRLDGVGEEVGPDLAKIGAKYPRPELLRQILEPSLSVDPKYTLYRLDTRSGLVHSGLLIERNEKEIVLRDAQNKPIRIAVAEVEDLTPQKQSLMPDLLLRGLTAQQAADLLEYLASLR